MSTNNGKVTYAYAEDFKHLPDSAFYHSSDVYSGLSAKDKQHCLLSTINKERTSLHTLPNVARMGGVRNPKISLKIEKQLLAK